MYEKLKVVCTPIGNLQDITFRAAETLKTADVVLCEDTRVSAKLLSYLGSSAKMLSCHQHNELQRVDEIAAMLEEGVRVCLISDAGAPAISDPGGRFVEALVELGIEIEVYPGPTAITALIMGAGIISHPHIFLGFLPRKKNDILKTLQKAKDSGYAFIIYESPHRIIKTLAVLFEMLGKRRVVVGRELTKRFESFHRGVLGEALTPAIVEKGEFVLIIEAAQNSDREDLTEEQIKEIAIELKQNLSMKPKMRSKKLAAATGMSNQEAYQYLLCLNQPC